MDKHIYYVVSYNKDGKIRTLFDIYKENHLVTRGPLKQLYSDRTGKRVAMFYGKDFAYACNNIKGK